MAIHEAGHAIAGHAYMTDSESTRLSIRMRGGSLGHHQSRREGGALQPLPERALRAPRLGARRDGGRARFYDENSSGVGGDVQSATAQAAWMVGASAMGPQAFAVEPKESETQDRRGSVLDALREHRPADHEPHERRRPDGGRSDRRCARSVEAEGRGADPRAGIRPRTRWRWRTAPLSSTSPTPCRAQGAVGDDLLEPLNAQGVRPRDRPERRVQLAGAVLLGLIAATAATVAGCRRGTRAMSDHRAHSRRPSSGAGPPTTSGGEPAHRAERAAQRLQLALRGDLLRARGDRRRRSRRLRRAGIPRRASRGRPVVEPGSPTAARRRACARSPTTCRGYRHPDGDQLVFAIGGLPQIAVANQGSLDVSDILVQPDTSTGQREEGDYDRYDGEARSRTGCAAPARACSIDAGAARGPASAPPPPGARARRSTPSSTRRTSSRWSSCRRRRRPRTARRSPPARCSCGVATFATS